MEKLCENTIYKLTAFRVQILILLSNSEEIVILNYILGIFCSVVVSFSEIKNGRHLFVISRERI